MPIVDRNILTPDFYEFLRSNKAAYGKTVLAQIHDASEKINIAEEEMETLAIVLSGYGVDITDGSASELGLYNQPEIVMLDGVPRRKVLFRSIDNNVYASKMQDFTGYLPSPLIGNLSNGEMARLISLHPSAYTLAGYFETKPIPYGSIVLIRKMGDYYYILENITSPSVKSYKSEDDDDDIKKNSPKRTVTPLNMVNVTTTKRMKPLLGLDGKSESDLTKADAGTNMQNETLKRYRLMKSYLNFDVSINDAIAKKGTSREKKRKSSAHFLGKALDLNIVGLTDTQKLQLLDAASQAGFRNFGFGKGILHVDWAKGHKSGEGGRRWPYPGTPKVWGGVKLGDLFKWVRPGKGIEGSGSVFKLLKKSEGN